MAKKTFTKSQQKRERIKSVNLSEYTCIPDKKEYTKII